MASRRTPASSTLAFIDVMACGLGSVLLLFILLDFDEATPPIIEPLDIPDNSQYYLLQDENLVLEDEISVVELSITLLQNQIVETIKDIAQAEVVELVEEDPAPVVQSVVNEISPGNKGDLLGIEIAGRKIVVLIDTSASMSYESLTDIIIGLGDPSGSYLSQGPKWSRAGRIAEWLVSNAPRDSLVKVLTYSDVTKELFSAWESPLKVEELHFPLLESEIPRGPTNLEAAIDYLAKQLPDTTNLYILTDGLPTKSSATTAVLNITKCGVPLLRSTTYVSGECREAIFARSLSGIQNLNLQVNVILLPLDGDPKATPYYWKWTSFTGGRLFTPERNWP